MLVSASLGAIVGLILAVTGAGGAIIAVPLLIFVLHWDVAHAAPVALLAVAASSLVGTVMGLRSAIVRYRAAFLMAGFGSVMTPLGVLVAHHLPPAPLALIFSAVLAFVAVRMFRQASVSLGESPPAQRSAACKLNSETGRFDWNAPCAKALSQAGLLTGFLSGLLGVGGGFLIVPSLRSATDLPMNSIIATSLMVIALISASAVSVSAAAGHLDAAVAFPFAGGAVAAMLAGRIVAGRLAGPRLQQSFAVLAGVVAVSLAIRTMIRM